MRHWRRRIVTLPVVVIAGLVTLAVSPLLLLAAVLADLVSDWRRHRWVRVLAMSLSFVVLELIAIIAAGALWIATGFGLAMGRDWSMRAHRAVQLWWSGALLRSIERCLGMTMTVVGSDAIAPGPVVVMARHTSFFDAPVPMVLVGRDHGLRLHCVLKRGLTLLPSLDLFGNRLPNRFVDRTPGDDRAELDRIRELTSDFGPRDAAVIFPEGTFFTEERQRRAVARVAERDADHARRAGALRHLLPPRPGGISSMLEGAPDADVIVVTHVGFEPFTSFRTILANVPFPEPVEVEVWRIPRAEVPEEPTARVDWLYDQWDRVDRWIDERGAR